MSEIVFHGTTKSKMNEVLQKGFDGNGKWIMFADKKSEAMRYAIGYCQKENDDEVLLEINLSDFNILSPVKYDGNDGFQKLKQHCYDHNIDGIFSDPKAGYYVIFNIEKLNEFIKNGKAKFNNTTN